MRPAVVASLLAVTVGCPNGSLWVEPDPEAAALAAARAEAFWANWDSYVSYVVGQREYSDLGNISEMLVPFGIDFTMGPQDSTLHFLLQYSGGGRSISPDDAPTSSLADGRSTSSTELVLGARQIWGQGRVRPFVGAGISVLKVDVKGPTNLFFETEEIAHDRSSAFWAGAGVYVTCGESFTLGLTVQGSSGHDLHLGDRDYDTDVIEGLVFLGARY